MLVYISHEFGHHNAFIVHLFGRILADIATWAYEATSTSHGKLVSDFVVTTCLSLVALYNHHHNGLYLSDGCGSNNSNTTNNNSPPKQQNLKHLQKMEGHGTIIAATTATKTP